MSARSPYQGNCKLNEVMAFGSWDDPLPEPSQLFRIVAQANINHRINAHQDEEV